MSKSGHCDGKRGIAGVKAVMAISAGLILLVLPFWYVHRKIGGAFLHLNWLTSAVWLLPVILLSFYVKPDRTRDSDISVGIKMPDVLLLLFMFLFLLSGSAKHPYFFLTDWLNSSGGPGIQSGLERVVLITAFIFPLLLLRMVRVGKMLPALMVLMQCACIFMFMTATGGKALWRDDHPSFLFRLWEFGKTFPQLRNYNPFWNGGQSEQIISVTGAASLGFLFWPLWKFLSVETLYVPALAATFIVIIPWMAYISLRIMKMGKIAAYCAGILALGVTQFQFLWLLKFGTVPSILSLSFVLPVAACLYRVIFLDGMEKSVGALLVFSSLMLIQWPLAGIPALVLVLAVLVNARKLNLKKIVFLGVCALIILAFHARTLAVIFLYSGGTVKYVSCAAEMGEKTRDLSRVWIGGLGSLSAQFQQVHPVVLFLGVGAVLAGVSGVAWSFVFPAMACLLFAATWGGELFPKMQLERMSIPALYLAIVPASVVAARIFSSGSKRTAVFLRACLFSILVIASWQTAKFYGNSGAYRYTVKSQKVEDLTAAITKYTADGGRVMFAGRTVHFYGGGHVAVLPAITGREMLACDYYHFPPDRVEYDYPPRFFRETPETMMDFMDLYDVICVVTYHESYKDFFLSNPDDYELVETFAHGDPCYIFRVKREPSAFLKGAGEVKASFNKITVKPENPAEEIVIKYNWDDGLSVKKPARIYPVEMKGGIKLIGIDPAGMNEVTIRFRSLL